VHTVPILFCVYPISHIVYRTLDPTNSLVEDGDFLGQFAVTEEGRAKHPTRVKSNVVYLDEYRRRIGFAESRATGH
jgi:hypothetical protein